MDLSRRSFLKGMMGLAGLAAVGLPLVEEAQESDLFDEIEQFLAEGGEPASDRPFGEYGSVRIDDQWYALHYGTVTPHMVTATLEADDFMVSTASRLIAWTAAFTIHLDPEIDSDLTDEFRRQLYIGKWHDIEYPMDRCSIFGNAKLMEAHAVIQLRDRNYLCLGFRGTDEMTIIQTM
jgi:hypothetical protein